MMMIYLGITLYIFILVILNLFEEEKLFNQLNAALVIIPLILRLLMIK
ncbi:MULTISPECIES: hypothetical protein [unclassified Cetobacterium]|nr:hypothetical protein [Cetobacterium sp. 8H]MBC2851732.1 hypothetical protein [Cetobacterium sp. 8H]